MLALPILESGPILAALKSCYWKLAVPITSFSGGAALEFNYTLSKVAFSLYGYSLDLQAAVVASCRNVCLYLILIGSCVYTCSLVCSVSSIWFFGGLFPPEEKKKEYIVLFQTVNFNWEGNIASRSLGHVLVLGFIFINAIKEILTLYKKCQVDNSWKCSCSIYAQYHSREAGNTVSKIILLRCSKGQIGGLWFYSLNKRL